MQIPSIGAEMLLNSMRNQLARLTPANAQQAKQIEASTSRQLSALEVSSPGAKGLNVDVSA